MASQGKVVYLPAQTGRAYWGPGDMYTFLITAEQSAGAYSMLEAVVPPGGGPPPHIHHREDETFYVLEGELSVRIGEKTVIASIGDFVNIPRGVVHCFKNEADQTARMIATFSPGGFEKFFEEVLQPVHDRSAQPPPLTQELIDRMMKVAPKYGLEFVPPTAERKAA